MQKHLCLNAFFLLVLCSGITATQCRANAQQSPAPVVLHFDVAANMTPVIQVRLNETTTVRFLFDTGSSQCVITDRLAAKMGLKHYVLSPPPAEPEVDEKGIPLLAVTLAHLKIGSLDYANVPMTIVQSEVWAQTIDKGIDGIVGANVFASCAVQLDFQKQQVTLWPGNIAPETLSWLQNKETFSVQLVDTLAKYTYSVPVSVNGRPAFQSIVDTVAGIAMLPGGLSAKLHLKPAVEDMSSLFFFGGFAVARSEVDTVRIGKYSMSHVMVQYVTDKKKTDDIPSILGLDFLMRHRVLLDFPHHLMYFQPVEHKTYAFDLKSQYPVAEAGFTFPAVKVTLSDGKAHLFGLQSMGRNSFNKPLADVINASPVGRDALQENGQFYIGPLAVKDTDLTFETMTLPVDDFAKLNITVPYIEGQLGFGFLQSYALSLDLAQNKMTLISPGFVAGTKLLSKEAKRLPLWATKQGYITEMEVDGKLAKFSVSLLSEHTVLFSQDLVKELHPVASIEETGATPARHVLLLHHIGINGAYWEAPKVEEVASPDAVINILGLDFLKHFHVILDFAAQSMYLEPNKDFKDNDPLGGIGLMYMVLNEGKLIVGILCTPSPAQEAGLRVGDEIISMNGLLVATIPQQQLSTETVRPLGTEVVIQFRHKGEDKVYEVRVKTRHLLP